MIFFTVIVGPVTARIAIIHGDAVGGNQPQLQDSLMLTFSSGDGAIGLLPS